MKAETTSGFVVLNMENPVRELDDFDGVVEQYRSRILRFLFASLGDLDLAETLTQECFWNAYKSRNAFRGDCSVHTWLVRIAVNLARSHVRRRRFQFWKRAGRIGAQEIHDWPDRSISPEERTSINEQVQAVWCATKRLSDRQRTVFLLRFVEECEIAEIAKVTGLSESAVNVHLFRAVRSLRKYLGTRK